MNMNPITQHTTDTVVPLKLDLGCGKYPKLGFLGVDSGPTSGAQIKQDVMEYLGSLDEGTVSEVHASHFLEHFEPKGLLNLLNEVNRVLVPGGMLDVTVPHFSNPEYYSDPTHRQAFGIYTFAYFCESSIFERDLPVYARISTWHLDKVTIGFIPRKRRRLLGISLNFLTVGLNNLINWRYSLMERYERYLCWIFPIYEIRYLVRKK